MVRSTIFIYHDESELNLVYQSVLQRWLDWYTSIFGKGNKSDPKHHGTPTHQEKLKATDTVCQRSYSDPTVAHKSEIVHIVISILTYIALCTSSLQFERRTNERCWHPLAQSIVTAELEAWNRSLMSPRQYKRHTVKCLNSDLWTLSYQLATTGYP